MKNSILRLQRAFFPISCGVDPIAVYDIIHGTSELQINLKDWNLDQRAGNFLELSCVNAILAFKKPKNVFEFGTGFGRMSYQFSLNTPEDCHIYTLDIFDAERGFIFKDKPTAHKITRIIGDSRNLDLSQYSKLMDFIFIDGGHDYETAKADTLKALEMVAPGGFILWDDFSADWPGVVKTVNEFKSKHKIFRIAGTSIAFARF